jgi:hypothetical protein
VGATHVAGAKSVVVLMSFSSPTYGDFNAELIVVVWFPTSVSVSADNPTLNVVRGGAADCATAMYQSTYVRALATFSGDGLASVTGMDVTPMVTLVATLAGVLAIRTEEASSGVVATVATGLATGTTLVGLGGNAAEYTPVTLAEVNVTANEVTVRQMEAVVVTRASYQVMALSDDLGFLVTSTLWQELAAEEDTAQVRVYATFSDGNIMDVTEYGGVQVEVESEFAADLAFDDASPPNLVVPMGAASVLGNVLKPVWTCDSDGTNGNATIQMQVGKTFGCVLTALPAPVAAVFELQTDGCIAPSRDLAVLLPFNTPTSTVVTVVLVFDDGAERDFTCDPRTVFTSDPNLEMEREFFQDGGCSASVRASPNATAGTYTVNVTFTHTPVNSSVEVEVCILVPPALISACHFDPSLPTSTACTALVDLKLIQCTDQYQQARMVTRLVRSDGRVEDASNLVTYETDVAGVVDFEQRGGFYIVSASTSVSADGESVRVRADFNGVFSSWLNLTVGVNVATLVSLVWTTSFASTTFRGLVDSTQRLQARAVFDDGTRYNDAFDPRHLYSVSDQFIFASSEPAAIQLSSDAVATLVSSSLSPQITLFVSSSCGIGSWDIGVAANVDPSPYDVDFGLPIGPHFAQRNPGERWDMLVRVASPNRLITFQVLP